MPYVKAPKKPKTTQIAVGLRVEHIQWIDAHPSTRSKVLRDLLDAVMKAEIKIPETNIPTTPTE